MSKICTPLWREAHFEVKMYKTPQLRTTFRSCDVEKVHAVVARSTFRSKSVQSTTCSDHFLTVQMPFDVAGARDCAPCQKWAKRKCFVAFLTTMAGLGHLKRIYKDAFSVAGAVQETCSSELLGGPGADFRASDLQVCWDDFAWQVQHFVWPRRSTLDRWSGKVAKRHWYEAVSSALNFPCLKEVSHNSFVFDVVNFEKWWSLAELLRFWRCQVQTLRKSRRILSFLMLSTSKNEEVSQNCFVFKLADRQIDRETTTTATTSTTTLLYYYNYKYKHTTLHYTTLITLRYTNYI